MPFYEYECSKCKTRFDAMLPMSTRDEEEKKLRCPACDAKDPQRLISSFSTVSSAPTAPRGTPPPACGPGG